MPDLGAYSFEVLSAYGVALFLLGWITAQSLWQARAAKRRLEESQKTNRD